MHSALAGGFVLLSIGILIVHAMEGYWRAGRRVPVVKDTMPVMRTSRAGDHRDNAAGS